MNLSCFLPVLCEASYIEGSALEGVHKVKYPLGRQSTNIGYPSIYFALTYRASWPTYLPVTSHLLLIPVRP